MKMNSVINFSQSTVKRSYFYKLLILHSLVISVAGYQKRCGGNFASKSNVVCNFELGLCSFSNSGYDTANWNRRSGASSTLATGPTFDHTYGNGTGKYIHIRGSRPADFNAKLVANQREQQYAGHVWYANMSFWYHMRGAAIGTLRVIRLEPDVNIQQVVWELSGHQGTEWLKAEILISSSDFRLVLEAVTTSGKAGDIAIDDFSLTFSTCEIAVDECSGARYPCDEHATCTDTVDSYYCSCLAGYTGDGVHCSDIDECSRGEDNCESRALCTNTQGSFTCTCHSVPARCCSAVRLECGWETSLCGWTRSDDDDFNWSIRKPTSSDEGPDTDMTLGNVSGRFLLIHSRGIKNGHKARIQSHIIQSSNQDFYQMLRISFWYHMKGRHVGQLTLYTQSNGTKSNGAMTEWWSRSGHQSNKWLHATVDVEDYQYEVLFEGVAGNGEYSDIAIDEVKVTCDWLMPADVNECDLGLDRCSTHGSCTNTPGSYSCVCERGYTGDGTYCSDYCSMGTDDCDSQATCTNTAESHMCLCPDDSSASGKCCSAAGIDTDFQKGALAWKQSSHDHFDWRLGNGRTELGLIHKTGPEADHTTGEFAGRYFYADSSNHADGDKARLESVMIESSWPGYQQKKTFTFWYHMRGGNVRTLSVFTRDDMGRHSLLWNKTGEQGENWTYASIDVIGYNYKLIIEAQSGEDHNGDIAIDDISMSCDSNSLYDDHDECGDSPCNKLASCANTFGSYYCSCNPGYTGDGMTSCYDVDECCQGDDSSSGCGVHALCTNTDGSYSCSCFPGHVGYGTLCSDIDECNTSSLNSCEYNELCANTDGSYTCECRTGYYRDGLICSDIDECETEEDSCDIKASCSNSDGSYICRCEAGYSGTGSSCSPLEECTSGLYDCPAVVPCDYIDGSCTCNIGYTSNSTACSDDNECTAVECDTEATCINTYGSYYCQCNDGYKGDGMKCVDTDECITGEDNCDVYSLCANTNGSYTCPCNTGYVASGNISCADMDECQTGGADDCDEKASCINSDGSYSCVCNFGYIGNGTACADIDECETQEIHIQATCINTVGSYITSCNKGYYGDGRICTDLDECSTGEDNCDVNSVCANSDASYSCTCYGGFTGNGRRCVDVDECTMGTHNCAGLLDCINTQGSFKCSCQQGYIEVDDVCTDINECSTENFREHTTCGNTEGGFTCTCNTVYYDVREHLRFSVSPPRLECGDYAEVSFVMNMMGSTNTLAISMGLVEALIKPPFNNWFLLIGNEKLPQRVLDTSNLTVTDKQPEYGSSRMRFFCILYPGIGTRLDHLSFVLLAMKKEIDRGAAMKIYHEETRNFVPQTFTANIVQPRPPKC